MILHGHLLLDPGRRPALGWVETEEARLSAMGDGAPPTAADLGGTGSVICPGFIDAHLHLPQIEVIGRDGLDLLDWLEQVIFPAEMQWADEGRAADQLRTAYARLLDAGTLGYAGYLSSHRHSLDTAIRFAPRCPLRAVAGQVLMDRHAPAALTGEPPARLRRSERGRLRASVNPRFAVSCSDELLDRAARRAGPDTIIQTHLAESVRECARVAQLFPDDPDYTSVYDRHGLLTPRTLLAHGIHLTAAEWRLIAERRSVVVHCPTANTFLRSGLFPLRAARDHGIRLALGSDVAAGPDLPMPRVARAMIDVAKMRAMTVEPGAAVPAPADAWDLITRGNAEALGWPDAGRLEIGAAADLLVLEPPFEIDEHLVARLIYTWRNEYIRHRIVAGKLR